MCGIIGYVGTENEAVEVILDGLSKLEYRGYDSAGLALIEDGKIFIEKKTNILGYWLGDMLRSCSRYNALGFDE